MAGDNDKPGVDPLAMSDEEFGNMTDSELEASFLAMGGSDDQDPEADDEDPAGEESENDDDEAEGGEPSAAAEEDEDDDTDGDEADDSDTDDDDAGDDDDTDPDSDSSDSDDDSDGDDESDDKDSDETDTDEIDAKTFMEKVTAEFKANGKMMRVDNPDDIVRLMQMGANYNRKMAGLKPSMKMLKMLENAELLNEDKLNYLIDLDQKNPAAIAKLLKDSEIDPLEFDMDQGSDYKAADRSVDEREMVFDDVVDSIKESPHYPKVIQLITKDWDQSSKQAVANEPQLLRVINDHMANGVYDLVSTEIDRERMLGRLDGVSDVEAYTKVGNAIAERGGFDHLNPSQDQGQRSKPNAPDTAKPASRDDKARQSKRRAASPSRRSAPKAQKQDFNPLSMSDDEFLKQANDKFL